MIKKISFIFFLANMMLSASCQESQKEEVAHQGEFHRIESTHPYEDKEAKDGSDKSISENDTTQYSEKKGRNQPNKRAGLKNVLEESTDGTSALPYIIDLLLLSMIGLLWFKLRKAQKIVKEKIDGTSHKLTLCDNRITLERDKMAQQVNAYIAAHDKGHQALVQQISMIQQSVTSLSRTKGSTHSKNAEDVTQRSEKKALRIGYFGMFKTGNGTAYFNDYPQSENDEAFFKMETSDEKTCTFAPFDIQRLKPLDMLEEAILFEGCPLINAKTIDRIVKPGTAIFHEDGNYWEIKDKAKIIIR